MTDLLQAAKEVVRQISMEHLSENAVESLRQAISEAEQAEPQHSTHYWQHEVNNARADGYELGYKAGKEQAEQEPVTWHHPQCNGQCIACLIEKAVEKEYGAIGRDYMLRHINPTKQPVKMTISEQAFNWIDCNAPLFVREAIAEANNQEPVAWLYDWENDGNTLTGWVTQDFEMTKLNNGHNVRPLYASPGRDIEEAIKAERQKISETFWSAVNSCITTDELGVEFMSKFYAVHVFGRWLDREPIYAVNKLFDEVRVND